MKVERYEWLEFDHECGCCKANLKRWQEGFDKGLNTRVQFSIGENGQAHIEVIDGIAKLKTPVSLHSTKKSSLTSNTTEGGK